MSTIKYSVWFHGNKDELEGLCWEHRRVFLTDSKDNAEVFKNYMLYDNMDERSKYSVCMIVINESE